MNIPLLILAILWVLSTLALLIGTVVYGINGRSDKFLTCIFNLVVVGISQGLLYAAGLWSLW